MNEQKKPLIRVCVSCGMELGGDATVCPRDGSILSAAKPDPLVGMVLVEKYEIHSLLGRGGMSTVYKARHILMDRWVALKVLRADLVHDPLILKRFQVESKAASLLRHPNTVTVYDFGISPEMEIPYLAMDYLEGQDLSTIIRQEKHLTPERTVNLMVQACKGLAHAHSKNVIHRDIKPSNLHIIKEDDGSELLKVLDFGIAKILKPDGTDITKLTATGDIFGSPAYMSPEQCHGQDADARSDIYSLGCVIYECLMGNAPLRGQSTIDMILKQVHEMPTRFAEARPNLNVPEALEQVVFKAMAKDPDQRFASMNDLAAALSESLTAPASQPKPATVPGFSAVNEDDIFDKTRPAGMAATPNEGPMLPAATAIESTEVRRPLPSTVVASVDLFGNEVLKPSTGMMAPPPPEMSKRVRQDIGNLFSSSEPADTVVPIGEERDAGKLFPDDDVKLSDVGSIFGSEKLLPAAPQPSGSPAAKTGGGDRGNLVFPEKGAEPLTGSSGTAGGGDHSVVTVSSRSTIPTGPSTTVIALGAVGAMVLVGIVSILAVMFVPPVRDQFIQMSPSGAAFLHLTDNPTVVGTTGSATKMDATSIYKTFGPSIVKLRIMSKCYPLTFKGHTLSDKSGDEIRAAKDTDGNLHFYVGGKPVQVVEGEIDGDKGKMTFKVGLHGDQPVLQVSVGNKTVQLTEGLSLVEKETEMLGSGFYVRPDVVCTSYFNVENPGVHAMTKWYGGDAQIGDSPAKLELEDPPIAADFDHALALLHLPSPGAGAQPLNLLTDDSSLSVGQQIYTIGAPRGYPLSLETGVISSDKLRDGDSNMAKKLFIQHSAKIDKGSFGGALFDDHGQVIGVNTVPLGNGAINLAVASQYVATLLGESAVEDKIKKYAAENGPDLGK